MVEHIRAYNTNKQIWMRIMIDALGDVLGIVRTT